mmetsp:Transcript_54932/g.117894  ORF Transcript_54932/g.117894 Transcript_54932/m.117894 type:complete len:217 (+) Transcript_54932:70-720(+)
MPPVKVSHAIRPGIPAAGAAPLYPQPPTGGLPAGTACPAPCPARRVSVSSISVPPMQNGYAVPAPGPAMRRPSSGGYVSAAAPVVVNARRVSSAGTAGWCSSAASPEAATTQEAPSGTGPADAPAEARTSRIVHNIRGPIMMSRQIAQRGSGVASEAVAPAANSHLYMRRPSVVEGTFVCAATGWPATATTAPERRDSMASSVRNETAVEQPPLLS